MKRWIGPVLVLLACAAGAHVLTLHFAPSFIMSRAMAALAERGVTLHRFTNPERVTPQTQNVVRSSPDLYYALCRYDLGNPANEVALTMAPWPDYQSLSFFGGRTDNFATLRGSGKAVSVTLLPPGSPPQQGAIVSPTAKGVILIRRLAPSAKDFAAASQAGAGDECRLVPREPVSLPPKP
jgi:uncharacterized membrane protein